MDFYANKVGVDTLEFLFVLAKLLLAIQTIIKLYYCLCLIIDLEQDTLTDSRLRIDQNEATGMSASPFVVIKFICV